MLDHLGDLKRTHHCGELRSEHVGQTVTLLGWVAKRRDLGNLTFVDIRDRWGLTQLVLDPEYNADAHAKAKNLRSEFVIGIVGNVRARSENTINNKLATGNIEVFVNELFVLNHAATPPFPIKDDVEGVGEELRLKHRYLDLRRPALQKNFLLRHKLTMAVRNYLDTKQFVELETPILTKSTPEGARDYLVPSRVHKGSFYALPQSPQIFKQLFMVSGFERYFQIARCFRDEDLRADRQPEFTQIDMEMSFVQRDDVYALLEGMMAELMRVIGVEIEAPFQRLPYERAMDDYGSDKPDLRYDMKLNDLSDKVADCGFGVFADCVANNGRVKAVCAPGAASKSRKEIESLESWLKQDYGIRGLAWLKYTEKGVSGPIKKFLGEDLCRELFTISGGGEGDILFFVADAREKANQALGALRCRLAEMLDMIPENTFKFLWVTDFPLVEFDDDSARYVALHHPFTSPLDEDLELLKEDPSQVRAKAYDLVLNGFEIGGGSIRIHRRDIQDAMFKALGLSEEEAEEKFGFLLNALSYGAPPHGGIALGLDRIAMLMANEKSLRDVIAFPKTTSAYCMMTDSPSRVSVDQLVDLGITVLHAHKDKEN
ncbi:aspartate--tRNA ligase [Sulfidibacter corallicola]|uniref:Aspartate--tRNA ligase n=1 Tax=Sulfidibacter corallicola TaxID=2818388 RepID=A0A8A4TWF3_SULCO|nr:aspartate--tRNA ligase [Sulfidibacter corallicola]QTD53511.1 aspartate--tRNA ligase [Sulfidibacter corallicola]